MKNLQEQTLNNQLNECLELQKANKNIKISYKNIRNDEYIINITIKKDTFKVEKTLKNDMKFALHLKHNYPINAPALYCLSDTNEVGAYISDLNDILLSVLSTPKWSNKTHIINIIDSIPGFIIRLYKEKSFSGGIFYLDEVYEYSIIEKIPHKFLNNVQEAYEDSMGNVDIIGERIVLITENYLLLFVVNPSLFSSPSPLLSLSCPLSAIFGLKQLNELLKITFGKGGGVVGEVLIFSSVTNEIMEVILEVFKGRKVDYLVNMEVVGRKREGGEREEERERGRREGGGSVKDNIRTNENSDKSSEIIESNIQVSSRSELHRNNEETTINNKEN